MTPTLRSSSGSWMMRSSWLLLLVACGSNAVVVEAGPMETSVPDASAPDVATVMDATEDLSGPWDPTMLGPLLVTWLDANLGVSIANNVVQSWADQSGQKNDASQTNASKRPAHVMGVLAGKPVLRFDGASDQFLSIADAPSLRWGTGDFAVAAVVAWTNVATTNASTGYGTIWVKTLAPNPFTGVGLFANDGAAPNGAVRGQTAINVYATTPSKNFNDGKFHVTVIRRTGATLEARGDGESATNSNSSANVDAPNVNVFIGARDFNTQMLKGDIAEILAVKGTLANGDLARLEKYLRAKYGL